MNWGKRFHVLTIPVLSLLMILIVCLRALVFGVVDIRGNSMEPVLKYGDRIVYWKIRGKIKRDQIVLFRKPGEKTLHIKRVLGLPQDSLIIAGGGVSFGGNNQYMNGADRKVVLPPGFVYVVGDNWDYSVDSRHFGPIPIRSIKGVYAFVLKRP